MQSLSFFASLTAVCPRKRSHERAAAMFDLEAIEARLGAPTKSDLVAEAMDFLGAQYAVNSAPVPQPTPGALSLLEALNCAYAVGGPVTADDVRLCFFVCSLGYGALGAMRCADIEGDAPGKMRHAAYVHAKARGILSFEAISLAKECYDQHFTRAKNAFNFFPRQDPSDTPLVFGAEWLSAVAHVCAQYGIAPHAAWWETPLVRVAFFHVQHARYEGAKNVSRANTLDWSKAFKEAV